MTLLAIASGKGGTGKSTLTLALAAAFASRGRSVVVLDLDPQAGLTDYAGLAPAPDPLHASPATAHGLTIFAGGRGLAGADDDHIRAHVERGAMLDPEAVVLADLSPAWTDAAHRAVLSRADTLLVLAVKLDAGGIRAARELTDLARARSRPFRIVGTFGKRWAVSQAIESSLRGFFGDAMCRTTLPEDVKAAEAAARRVPLPLYAPRSRAGQAVEALVDELGLAVRNDFAMQSEARR